MKDRSPLALAGVWETYSGGDGSEIDTVAIITTSANAEVAPLHNRMPAIISPPDFSLWLDSSAPNLTEALSLLRPAPDGLLEIEPYDPVKGPLTLEKHPLKRPKDENKTRKSDQFDLF
jgi:putative SOS response-associated peptidase YedK